MVTGANTSNPPADDHMVVTPAGVTAEADSRSSLPRPSRPKNDQGSYHLLVVVLFVAYTVAVVGVYLWRGEEITPSMWGGLLLIGVLLLGQWTGPLAARLPQGRLLAVAFIGFMLTGLGLSAWRGIWFTPDRWAVLLFVGAVVLGQGLAFLRDWVPVIMLIFGYEFMRGVAGTMVDEQNRTVHVTELINGDRFLFGGHLPTVWLQRQFYHPGNPHWYDYLAVLVYALHFIFPLVFAFILWINRKDHFWQFSLTFLLMTYAAFAFFLFYPAAPPWLADRWGFVPEGIKWPAGDAYRAMVPERYDNFDTYQIWNKASGNAVAAFPSLHAGFPWLTLLYAVKFFGRRGLIFFIYSPLLWFSVVYLGHHWVIDILGGIAWATICFVTVQLIWPWVARGISVQMPSLVRRRSVQRSTEA